MLSACSLLLSVWFIPIDDCIVDDIHYFPPKQYSIEASTFSKHHYSWLMCNRDGMLPFVFHYDRWVTEARASYNAWGYLALAHIHYELREHDECTEQLELLRRCIGDDNYMLGKMPEVVPYEYFTIRPVGY